MAFITKVLFDQQSKGSFVMILGCLSASSLSAALATEIAFTCSFSVCSQSDLTHFTCTSGFKSRTPTDRQCQIFKSLCIFLLCLAHIGYLTGFCFLDTTLRLPPDQSSLPTLD
ncbi:hypothetical protein GOODEAATRI_012576 [Goodea atripinnis]|uniref:CASP-like protein n=1 Tax=Goodea atripinnis TaxID=208336 RepID=A0ABV0MRI5_9TELE